MPDITMCKGQIDEIVCPYKDQCYRFTAKAGDYQSYFMELPLKDNKCDYYWGKNEEDILNKLKEIT
jgi:hypothetical protein